MTDEANVTSVLDWLEDELRARSAALVDPRDGECLLCYVARVVDDFGCDTTLRWARRFRDTRAPAATALERRLSDVGGFCDCEIFLNGFTLAGHLRRRDADLDDLVAPARLPTCVGVRRGSTRPCGHWVRLRWS